MDTMKIMAFFFVFSVFPGVLRGLYCAFGTIGFGHNGALRIHGGH